MRGCWRRAWRKLGEENPAMRAMLTASLERVGAHLAVWCPPAVASRPGVRGRRPNAASW
jgi:hypothetical protein